MKFKTPRDAATTNANLLAEEAVSWRQTVALGLSAVTFALLEVAEALREGKT
jgi:hypothetical protein